MTASESLIPIVHLCPIPASECCFSLVADVIARLTGTRLALGGSLTEPMAKRRGDIWPAAGAACLLTLPADPRVQTIARSAREEGVRALPDGSVDTSGVEGVDADLRVRPFFYHGGMFSIREFIVGALKNELGLAMADDPDLATARSGGAAKTATGMLSTA